MIKKLTVMVNLNLAKKYILRIEYEFLNLKIKRTKKYKDFKRILPFHKLIKGMVLEILIYS